MTVREDMLQRKKEWEEVAAAIDRGEHPYNNLTNELTERFGKFAHGMVRHLDMELAKLDKELELK